MIEEVSVGAALDAATINEFFEDLGGLQHVLGLRLPERARFEGEDAFLSALSDFELEVDRHVFKVARWTRHGERGVSVPQAVADLVDAFAPGQVPVDPQTLPDVVNVIARCAVLRGERLEQKVKFMSGELDRLGLINFHEWSIIAFARACRRELDADRRPGECRQRKWTATQKLLAVGLTEGPRSFRELCRVAGVSHTTAYALAKKVEAVRRLKKSIAVQRRRPSTSDRSAVESDDGTPGWNPPDPNAVDPNSADWTCDED